MATLSYLTFGSRVIGRRARNYATAHFPLLDDPLNTDCPQLDKGKKVAEKQIAQLDMLTKISRAGGGEKGIAFHTKKNKKMIIHERMKHIFDDSSEIFELGVLTGLGLEYGDIPGATMVTAIGKIHDSYAIVTGSDATLKGGTYFPITVKKGYRAQEISESIRLPAVTLVDSGGGFLPLQADLFPDRKHGGRSFYNTAFHGSLGIPQLAIVNGSCTAGAAYAPSMCEENVIVNKIGTIFLAGPPLVYAATGEKVTAEELGGADTHTRLSGVSDYFAHDEMESFDMVRDSFSTLNITPSSDVNTGDPPIYSQEQLNFISGLSLLDKDKMYSVILRLADGSRFREFKKRYGENLIAGYLNIEGKTFGLLANSGPISQKDGLKGAQFVQICEHRDLPIVFLQNSGALGGVKEYNYSLNGQELGSTLKSRSAMAACVASSTVHKITINVGGCIGDDNYTMCGPSFEPRFIFSWPNASTIHSMNTTEPEDQPKEEKAKGKSKFQFPDNSAWYMASRNLIDNIILPSDTRKIISNCINICNQQNRLIYKSKRFPVLRL